MNFNKPTDTTIRHALRGLATEISTENPAPTATLIYLRSERRARQLAIARATLPLRIMQTLGLIVAIIAAAWAIHQTLATPSTTTQSLTTNPLIKWVALALSLVVGGCWTLLRASRADPELEARS